MTGGPHYSQNRYISQTAIVFWEYTDKERNHPIWGPKAKQWSLGYRKVSLTELGVLCKLSEDELTWLKLKYGG